MKVPVAVPEPVDTTSSPATSETGAVRGLRAAAAVLAVGRATLASTIAGLPEARRPAVYGGRRAVWVCQSVVAWRGKVRRLAGRKSLSPSRRQAMAPWPVAVEQMLIS